MKYEGYIKDNLVITEHSEIMGLVAGDVEVKNGSILTLHGMVQGDLHLEAGCSAGIHGLVTGEVFGSNVKLSIFGHIIGDVVLKPHSNSLADCKYYNPQTKS